MDHQRVTAEEDHKHCLLKTSESDGQIEVTQVLVTPTQLAKRGIESAGGDLVNH